MLINLGLTVALTLGALGHVVQRRATQAAQTQATQFPPDHQVALVIAGKTQTIRLGDAERRWKQECQNPYRVSDKHLCAALTVALGTLRQDTVECHREVRENDWGELFTCGN